MARLPAPLGGALVLDAQGLTKLAAGDPLTRYRFEAAKRRRGNVVTAASTLPEVLRGGPKDALLYRVLNRITVVKIEKDQGRSAGELLGRTGLTGHRCALDALLAVVAMAQPGPVVLLTSDPNDMAMLTEEPERPQAERIAIIRI
ncbi:MAG TPA: PIN domain-containing protein [Streptosporangiaceae bacterium]